MYRYLSVFLVAVLFLALSSEGEAWNIYTSSLWIRDMEIRGDYLWCATRGGVTKWKLSDMTYEKMTSMDGLSTNDINSIAVGDDGRVWVLPDPYGGVNMFDGHTWVKYSTEVGLADMGGWELVAGKNGDVIVHSRGGFSRFDGNRWSLLTQEDGLVDKIENYSNIFAGNNGDILFTGPGGLVSFDGNDWKIVIPKDEMPTSFVFSVAIDESDSTVWCATHYAIIRYRNSQKTEFTKLDGVTDGIKTLLLDDDGNLWAGIQSYEEEPGLVKYDGDTWTAYSKEHGLPSNAVYALELDDTGTLWIGTKEGLTGFDGVDFQIYKPENEIANKWTRSVTVNGSDIWVGTTAGISRFNGAFWETYTVADNLAGNSVYAVLADRLGIIWAATDKGLSRFDGMSWETVLSTYCLSLENGEDGATWAGTRNDGVFRIDGDDVTHYQERIPNVDISCIESGGDGKIWVGTQGSGIFVFDNGQWTNYTTLDGLKSDYIWSLEAGGDGGMWAGTYMNGVCYFDGQKWTDVNLMKNDGIFSIETDSDGNLWFGGYSGLTRYNGVSLLSAQCDQGLVCDFVQSIAFSDENEIWVVTGYGVANGAISDIVMEPTSVEKSNMTPCDFELKGIYPNPFNLSTTISFNVFSPGTISISIYNITGQKTRDLCSGKRTSGIHTVTWDGNDGKGVPVSAGIYLIKISSDHNFKTGKVLYLK